MCYNVAAVMWHLCKCTVMAFTCSLVRHCAECNTFMDFQGKTIMSRP